MQRFVVRIGGVLKIFTVLVILQSAPLHSLLAEVLRCVCWAGYFLMKNTAILVKFTC